MNGHCRRFGFERPCRLGESGIEIERGRGRQRERERGRERSRDPSLRVSHLGGHAYGDRDRDRDRRGRGRSTTIPVAVLRWPASASAIRSGTISRTSSSLPPRERDGNISAICRERWDKDERKGDERILCED
ncbi:hypothetical protein ACFX13_036692 [Malus domestica]